MYLWTCVDSAAPQIANYKSANCKSAKCHICGRSAYLTNYLNQQICSFATCGASLRTAHICLLLNYFYRDISRNMMRSTRKQVGHVLPFHFSQMNAFSGALQRVEEWKNDTKMVSKIQRLVWLLYLPISKPNIFSRFAWFPTHTAKNSFQTVIFFSWKIVHSTVIPRK